MYAIVENGVVVNVVVWDGSDSWAPPDGVTAVAVTAETGPAFIGGAYTSGQFTAPVVSGETAA